MTLRSEYRKSFKDMSRREIALLVANKTHSFMEVCIGAIEGRFRFDRKNFYLDDMTIHSFANEWAGVLTLKEVKYVYKSFGESSLLDRTIKLTGKIASLPRRDLNTITKKELHEYHIFWDQTHYHTDRLATVICEDCNEHFDVYYNKAYNTKKCRNCLAGVTSKKEESKKTTWTVAFAKDMMKSLSLEGNVTKENLSKQAKRIRAKLRKEGKSIKDYR